MSARLADLPLNAILGSHHVCSCGKTHTITTRKILVQRDVEKQILPILHELSLPKRVFLVSDENTYAVAGKNVSAALSAQNTLCGEVRLHGGELHADESALGALLTHIPENEDITLLSVGSGTLSDVTRYVAHRLRLPFCLYGTAPSMDGYASSVSPLLSDGFKCTFSASAPEAIFADPRVLAQSPRAMIAAGLGDILGKYTALADWYLARDVRDEYICEEIIEMVYRAVEQCASCADALANRDEQAAQVLFEALNLTGFAIQMAGVSRPASGSEHKMSHFLEMLDMQRGRAGTLHGDKVGMATIVVMDIYTRLFARRRTVEPMIPHGVWLEGIRKCFGALSGQVEAEHARNALSPKQLQAENARVLQVWEACAQRAQKLGEDRPRAVEMLQKVGGPVHPHDLGYSKEDLYLAILYAKDIRPRYTVFNVADHMGALESIAREVSDAYFA